MAMLKVVARAVLGALFVLAGIGHLVRPGIFVQIMPPYLPWPLALVYGSGLCEIGLGALLLVPRYATPAGWGLIALLIAVFPANVYMATHAGLFPRFNPVALWARLPLQGVLIAWAFWMTRP
jgi:uncharacterized membrane protein